MFLEELRTLPEDLVARLDPMRVQDYLCTSGWVHQPDPQGKVALYHRPESDLEQIILPLSRKLTDFTPRMAEAVACIAEWEKRPALEVLDDLLPSPPPGRQMLVGYVDMLEGQRSGENQQQGPVTLRLLSPEGSRLLASTELKAADYHTAQLAHEQGQPITLQGIVRRVGGTFRIDEVTGFRMLRQVLAPLAEGA